MGMYDKFTRVRHFSLILICLLLLGIIVAACGNTQQMSTPIPTSDTQGGPGISETEEGVPETNGELTPEIGEPENRGPSLEGTGTSVTPGGALEGATSPPDTITTTEPSLEESPTTETDTTTEESPTTETDTSTTTEPSIEGSPTTDVTRNREP